MIDINEIKKRLTDYRMRADCIADQVMCRDVESLLAEVDRLKAPCLDEAMWIRYTGTTGPSEAMKKIDQLERELKSMTESRNNGNRQCNELLETKSDLLRRLAIASEGCTANRLECDKLMAELDELRTRHARLIDSTDTFVAALVDERFKKDHASMLAELHTLRTKDIEASKRLRIEINAMPETVRAIFESARVDAKSKSIPIVRALVDMVATARIAREGVSRACTESRAECAALKDECRKHLARINVLESENIVLRDDNAHVTIAGGAPVPMMLHCPMCHARHIDEGELATRPHRTHACQTCGVLWRPAIVATVGVHFLPGCKNDTTFPANELTGQDVAKVEGKANDATSANVVPDNVLQRAVNWANQKTGIGHTSHDMTSARAAIAQTFRDSDWCIRIREFVKLWREGQAPDMPLASKHNGQPCTCPATSEYDPPCVRHGVVGIGATPRD